MQGLGRGRRGFALVARAAGDEKLALGRGEVPGGGWGVGEEEPAEEAEGDGGEAFEDEEPRQKFMSWENSLRRWCFKSKNLPPPSTQVAYTIHIPDCVCQ